MTLLIITSALFLAAVEINYGIINLSNESDVKKLGKNDVTLDMYGWKQLGEEFSKIGKRDVAENIMKDDAPIISYRWFPAANIDYYVSRHTDNKVLTIGKLEKVHKYAWINKYRGGFKMGMDAYYITSSRDYKDPYKLYGSYFTSIEAADTIRIYRGGENVKNAFIFRLRGLKKVPKSDLPDK